MLYGKQLVGLSMMFLPLVVHSIGLNVSGNTCDGVVLSKSLVSDAGSYFDSYKDCTAEISVTDLGSSDQWTLLATISDDNVGLPVSIFVNGSSNGFQYLNSATEVTLSTGTGPTVLPLPVTVRINQISADDGSGTLINHATINYKVKI